MIRINVRFFSISELVAFFFKKLINRSIKRKELSKREEGR